MKALKTLTIACGLAASAALLSAAPASAANLIGRSVGKLNAMPISPAQPAFSTQCLANFIGPYVANATVLQTGLFYSITLGSQSGTQAVTQLVMTDSLAGPVSTATAYLGNLQTFENLGVIALSTELSGVHLNNLQATLTYFGADRVTKCIEKISGSFKPLP